MQQAAIVRNATTMFRQGLAESFAEVGLGELCPARFASLISGLRVVANRASMTAFVAAVETCESSETVLARGGHRFRCKQASTKNWLTPFARAEVTRRDFQPDTGGQGVIPTRRVSWSP